jgi:signal transduction histidine kinase
MLKITISDNSVGVAAQDQPHLFEMFSQGRFAIDHSEGGLGSGLALSKGLPDLHGGSVTAHSDAQGKACVLSSRCQSWKKNASARRPCLSSAARVAASDTGYRHAENERL